MRGWGSAGRTGARADGSLGEQRLARLAERWRVPGAVDDPGGYTEADDPLAAGAGFRDELGDDAVRAGRRLRLGPWTGSALRGIALLLAVAVAVAGYWAWTGRPRAVAVAPSTLATGSPADVAAQGPAGTGAAAEAVEQVEPVQTPFVEPPSPPVETPGATPATDAAGVVVHVTGQVARPGLVRLPAGSRVADAVEAAGGVTKPRAADSVNLARVVADGEQIVVGPGASPAPAAGTSPTTTNAGPLDLNTADAAALDALPGVGPVLAGRILLWRQENGSFRSVDELGEVSGIGEAILARLRPLVRV